MGFSEQSLLENYPFSGESKMLVDVGAHHGWFTKTFAKRDWSVLAFEPEKNNRAAFERNLSSYDNVTCLPFAVSDKSGEKVPFFVSEEHFGIHSLKPFHHTHKEAYEVETVRLDDVLSQYNIQNVNLLKIDTEGADYFSLRGFDFDLYRPEIVIIEFMDERTIPHFGYSHHDVVAYMAKKGYEAFVSEWAPIKEYAREGVTSEPHTWLQCSEYPLDHDPAWGNLIFFQAHSKAKFLQTLDSYLQSVKVSSKASIVEFVKKIPGVLKLYRAISGN